MKLALVRPISDELEFGYCLHEDIEVESGWVLCLNCGDWWAPFIVPFPKLVVRRIEPDESPRA